jgi:acyl-coenzyme A synthetase/AMP-(fatty) acid ligase
VIRLREGRAATEVQSDALRAYVKTRLQPYKYPRIVDYVADLPKTGTGKIDRQALAAMPVRQDAAIGL